MEGRVSPLLAVELLFRSKRAFGDLPHVVDAVSEFLDSSVELPLHKACTFSSIRLLTRIWERSRIWAAQHKNQETTIGTWTLSKYLTTDPFYRQYEFSLCMRSVVSCQNLEMVKWLSNKCQGCTITSEVVTEASKAGAMNILQFFNENDRRLLDPNDDSRTIVGHAVEWGEGAMEAAILGHRADIVWWLKTNVPDAAFDRDAALKSALKCGEIFVAEWLLAQGAEWPRPYEGVVVACCLANAGRLDVLKWLDTKGKLGVVVGLVVNAAEKGHLAVARWAVDRDEHDIEGDHLLTGLGGEASLAIHIAATNGRLQVAKYLRTQVQTPVNARERELEAEAQNVLRGDVCMSDSSSWGKVLPVSGETMMLAVENGHLDVVKWLVEEYGEDPAVDIFSQDRKEREHSTSPFAMVAAARNGHLAVLQYLHELEISRNNSAKKRKSSEVTFLATPKCSTRAMDDAAANGHLGILRWLHQNRTEGCTSSAWAMAAAGGHLCVLKWLHEHRLGSCTASAMDCAAASGKLDVVQWLHANTSAGCTTMAMDAAAEGGHLDVVQWLHAHRTEGCTVSATSGASARGALAVVKWLHCNRTEGCPLKALYGAVVGGHLHVVKWLVSHGLQGKARSLLSTAAMLDRLDIFLFLHDAYSAKCTEDVAAAASDVDSLSVLSWILGHYPDLRAAVANRPDLL